MDSFEYEIWEDSNAGIGKPSAANEDSSPQYTPEGRRARKLWLTVLARAVEEGYHERNLLVGKDGDIAGLRREAREWLGTDSPGLRDVCQMAGIEYQDVLELYGKDRKV